MKVNKKTMNFNLDFEEDAFFDQTPAQLKCVAELMGFPPDFFKYTFRKLVEYSQLAGIRAPARETPKRRLIRKILKWHQRKIYEDAQTTTVQRTRTVSAFGPSKAGSRRAEGSEAGIQRTGGTLWDGPFRPSSSGNQNISPWNAWSGPRRSLPLRGGPEEAEGVQNSDMMLCILCYSEQRCIVYNDCHHLVCCMQCEKKCRLKCPICNTVNKTTQRVYIC